MHTSTSFVVHHSSGSVLQCCFKQAAIPAAVRPPRLHQAAAQHVSAGTNRAYGRPQPPCSASTQRSLNSRSTLGSQRVVPKHHVRGWGSFQQRSVNSRGCAVAASDDDDSPALQVYSSTDASSSEGSSSDAEAAAAAPPDADGSVATIQLDMPRRSMQVTFTCDKCGERTARMVNPLAWDKGLVLAQCRGCEAWHKLRDAAGLVEEIRYTDEDA